MAKFEVFYSYAVDAKAVIEAPDKDAAKEKLIELWVAKTTSIVPSGEPIEEYVESSYDLDVIYTKRR